MIYKRGGTWWFKFVFNGQLIRESAKTQSKTVAKDAEKARRREVEEGFHGISRRRARLFSVAAQDWLDFKRPHLAPRSVEIEKQNLVHLKPFFGGMLLGDITPEDIARYQEKRRAEGASPKTINLEVGTVRAILRRNRLWANLQPDVRMLPTRDDVGRAISAEEETALLQACLKSRSRSLYPVVTVALSTGMRYSEIRLLKWGQVDFAKGTLTVGNSKTEAGAGRVLPLCGRALEVLKMWAGFFPNREPQHYIFPAEKCGAAGDDFKPCVYGTDPTKPIGDWKEAWEAAKERAGAILKGKPDDEDLPPLACRFHDLRHTACTRLLEAGTPFSVVASIMGWSPSTTVRMAKRYGHIGQAAQREAVKALDGAFFGAGWAQNWAQSGSGQKASRPN